MHEEGPLLESLTRRLAECPSDFLVEPRTRAGDGQVHVGAVVFDLLRDLGGAPLAREQVDAFLLEKKRGNTDRESNRLRLTLITCWLLHDVWFRSRGRYASAAYELLTRGLTELAELVRADTFVTDPDRREELVRLCLKTFGLRPAGETQVQAQDRLTTLDSVERVKVVKAAREAEERARQIREEMARKAAEEAAATYGRE